MSQEPVKPEVLQTAFPTTQVAAAAAFGPEMRLAAAHDLPAICAQLKTRPEFGWDVLEDYTALDSGENFELVLHLVSSQNPNQHLTLKAQVPRGGATAPTLTGIYASAEWYEREIFDMFGITFSGHPDLRRILLPEDWQGFPLRKDYQDERMLKRPGA